MEKEKNSLTKKQKKELEELMKQMTDEAIKVREDYKKNSTELSGSVTQVHANSPILKEDKDAD
tara:strand:+ start:395 stop:583 length:189 start_codon:yes stop_codon:yes gene_type:complete